MLTYLLALIVGLSSFGLYMAAFFFPEVHRKNDFIWSGLGLFYALVLWVCAGRITGGVLLGQTASVTLLGWLGWQTLTLRRQVAPVDQQTAVPTAAEWQAMLSNAWAALSRSRSIAPLAQPIGKQFAKLSAWVEALVTTTTKPTEAPSPKAESQSYVPLTPADFANASQDAIQSPKTIATDAASAPSVSKNQSGESPLTAIAKQVQGAIKGLTAKPESKPVYVRKQFRKPDVETTPTVDVASVNAGSDRTTEPATPTSDVVDAEAKEFSTPPPQTVEAEVLPDPKSTE
ncbi:MAG: hypothetical protein KME42_07175 [Tildeniella nuda ZEHNDER 1965/U140]|jgi:hypothetical protein|nr:hypothetical protein [Tildeniella nuda ZEHNDER 1965/U140]